VTFTPTAKAVAAADHTAVWTWSSDPTVDFVRRRVAHECLIHRLDAQLTAKPSPDRRRPGHRRRRRGGDLLLQRNGAVTVPPHRPDRRATHPRHRHRKGQSNSARSWALAGTAEATTATPASASPPIRSRRSWWPRTETCR